MKFTKKVQFKLDVLVPDWALIRKELFSKPTHLIFLVLLFIFLYSEFTFVVALSSVCILAVAFYKWSEKALFICAIFLFLVATSLLLFEEKELANSFAEYAYYFLVLALIWNLLGLVFGFLKKIFGKLKKISLPFRRNKK